MVNTLIYEGSGTVETAIGIVGGAIVSIVITVLIEILRRPKLQMTLVPGEEVRYPPGNPAIHGRYLHIKLVNEALPWPFRWLSRDAALQCRGTITFHHLNGGLFLAASMPIRFSRSPEPLPLQIRSSSGSGVLLDPVRMSLDSRFDLYAGEETPFDVAVKFDSESEAYGWTNQNYFSDPKWRNPDLKLPQGRYIVKATIKSSNATCSGNFQLCNDAGPKDFRLEIAPKNLNSTSSVNSV